MERTHCEAKFSSHVSKLIQVSHAEQQCIFAQAHSSMLNTGKSIPN